MSLICIDVFLSLKITEKIVLVSCRIKKYVINIKPILLVLSTYLKNQKKLLFNLILNLTKLLKISLL